MESPALHTGSATRSDRPGGMEEACRMEEVVESDPQLARRVGSQGEEARGRQRTTSAATMAPGSAGRRAGR